MERDSFIFYKSFYEAVRDLPKEIRLEVFTAIIEYALYGISPQNLKPFANSIFTLVKPNIDINTVRYENGKKGGRKRSVKKQSAESPQYSLTYEQEVNRMREDSDWIASVCKDFEISPDEFDSRLSRFLRHCNDEKKRKGKQRHDSFDDAQSHLRYWLSKAYPRKISTLPTTPRETSASLDVPDNFGAADYDEK